MYYVILNDEEYFKNKIDINRFNEVSINGNRRVDGVFTVVTKEILESRDNDIGRGEEVFENSWLCRDRGVQFVVVKIPQDILYTEHQEYIEKCFGLFDTESFYVELWSIKLQDQEKYEYFIIGFNKSFEHKIIFDEEFIEKQENEVVKYICEKIEEKLYK